MTVIVTVPPRRRELLCSTALVTVSEASKTATSAAGLASPRDFSTNERAAQTCSGRPGIVRLPRTEALAIMARSCVASLARVANRALLPPSGAAPAPQTLRPSLDLHGFRA